MKHLNISEDLKLPLDAVTQTIAVVARKRVGKTYTASVLAEEFIEAKLPIVVLDPTGAWWGLRASADGRSEGYPVIIIGGAHADVPLEDLAGKVIADLVVDHPGFYIIDFSQMESDAAVQRFALDFARRFYFRKQQHRFPMHLFVDEADVFVPQEKFPEQKHMAHAFDVLVRRGGIYGIGVTLITQRPALLNKNVLTQCETLIALQISGSQDVDAIEHWMRIHGTKEQKAEFLGSIGSLQMGVAWFWSPSWLQVFQQVRIRLRRTFNSSATPKAGEKALVPAKLAAIDVEKLGAEIKATIQKVKENDPKELKAENARLQKELHRRDTETQRGKETVKEVVKEVLVFTEADRALLKRNQQVCEDVMAQCDQRTEEIRNVYRLLNTMSGGILVRLQQAKALSPLRFKPPTRQVLKLIDKCMGIDKDPANLESHHVVSYKENGNGEADAKLSAGERKVMIAIAQYPEGVSRETLKVLTGYKATSLYEYARSLAAKGFSGTRGDLILPTDRGVTALGDDYESLPTGDALVEWWRHRLSGGELKIFEIVVANAPKDVSRDKIMEVTGFKSTSTYEYTRLLKARRVVVDGDAGGIVLHETFFE